MDTHRQHRTQAGFTIVELIVATTLFTVVLLSSMALMDRDANLSKSTLSLAVVEDRAEQMLHRLEGELADALIASPTTVMTFPLPASETGTIQVANTLGFPESGTLMLSRGTADFEVVTYDNLGGGNSSFVGLTRGQACTDTGDHPINMEIVWAGLAEPIPNQVNPTPDAFDGQALEQGTGVFFRGAGAGISYRIPVDPAGGTNYLAGEDIQWGASPGNVQTLAGWNAIEFVPRTSFTEAETGDDVNGDGDLLDTFDVGQLRRRTWDTSVPGGPVDDLGLGPSAILQEQCAWGSDLDADGFEDPIFLWDAATRTLHIRLFLIGRSNKDVPVVRQVESVVFLRNDNGL